MVLKKENKKVVELQLGDYYGRHVELPDMNSNIADDLIYENDMTAIQLIKEVSKNLRHHISECKRDIIKEIYKLKGEKHGRDVKRSNF